MNHDNNAAAASYQRAADFGNRPSFGPAPDMGAPQAATGRDKFEAAVREFATWVNLDPEGMLTGETFRVNGVPITLMHYGIADPGGATVIVDYGAFTPETELVVLRGLLEHNLQTPGARHGYFAVAPEVNRIFYCMRVELDNAQNGAAAIGQTVGMAVQSAQALASAVVDSMDVFTGKGSAGLKTI
ncbi:MAG: hypothetical protein K0Q43_3696 [Ramlibacter sp.]|jgi:hypothetical protein|nr:hypothetical protein [Ramlibacter sp.]